MKKALTIPLCLIVGSLFAGNNDLNSKSTDTVSEKNNKCLVRNIVQPAVGDDEGGKQVVKINLTQLALKNLSFQYEYVLLKNLSAGLGFNVLMKQTMPSQIAGDPAAGTTLPIPSFKGWAVTPELRYYPGKKEEKQAPHGFYLAPFFRYGGFTMNTTMKSSSVPATLDVTAKYKGYAGGLMIGTQWTLGKHFAIDWWILGGGWGKAKLDIDAKSTGAALSAADQLQYKDDINSTVGDFVSFLPGAHTVTTTTTSNSLSSTVTGLPKMAIRGMGLCFGIRF